MSTRIAKCLLVAAASVAAQPLSKFEVVSVKPADPADAARAGIVRNAARVEIGYWSLKQLILRAYGLWPSQLSGPEWMEYVRFDISGKLPEGASQTDFPEMLQNLLAERFGLKAHTETKPMSAYALVVTKHGPKMTASAPDETPGASGLSPIEEVGRTLDRLWSARPEFGMTALDARPTAVSTSSSRKSRRRRSRRCSPPICTRR